jgi:hypothetical protein
MFIPHAQNPYLVMNVVMRTTIDADALACPVSRTAAVVRQDLFFIGYRRRP